MQCRLWRMIDRLHPTRSAEPLFRDWAASRNWSMRRQMKSFVIHHSLTHCHSVIPQSPRWPLSDTDSVTDLTVSWSIQHDLALTPRDLVSGRSRSLAGYAENHKWNDQRTWQNNRDFLSSLDWSLELKLGHEVEPSQLQCFTILLTTFTSPIVTNCNLIHLTTSSNNTLQTAKGFCKNDWLP